MLCKSYGIKMEQKRFLHCKHIFSDGILRLNDVDYLPDGRLFSFAVSRKTPTKAPVTQLIYGRVSSDGGKTWTPSGFFYEIPDRQARFYPGDFIIDKDGRIHIFLLRILNVDIEAGEQSCRGSIAYLRLDNEKGDGCMFKAVLECLDRYSGSMNNCIQTKSGRIVAPFSTIAGTAGSPFVSNTIYSDDGGENWYASNDVQVVSDETHLESGAVEPVVVEVADGILVMLIRTVLNCFYYSVSYDDGASWSEAKPTRIPSSNAPCVPVKLPDGRILLSWNDVLGQPMSTARYSFARQCLHAAVSNDGLKTLEGVRTIVSKRAGDPDGVLNCYPFGRVADEKNVLLRPMSIDDMEKTTWEEPEGMLLLINPDDLTDCEMQDSFYEWVCDCPVDDGGIRLIPTVKDTAYACVNFPYARKGEIRINISGELPSNMRVILSDCYADRLTFIPRADGYNYKTALGEHLAELTPKSTGEWIIKWDSDKLCLEANGKSEVYRRNDTAEGFNHMMLVFEGQGELNISNFKMKAFETGMSTGIEY